MPLLPTIGRTVGTSLKALRMLVRGSVRGSAWATRRVGDARARGAANEIGMVRLFDLHALSCAGDTLIAIGLAGTIFFNVPLGEARSKVALYLLITMVPFALLAPVVGPLLDHFRHGRRYALAASMLGRAFLAYVISDNLLGWGLYPAAFGVLALSRAYGVAKSAAVPRLLPDGVGLSQVGARAAVYGTFAGAVVAPIGLAAFWFGPQWPLRVASVIFLVGMVIALRLPPRADSDPPEAVPRPFRTMLRLRRGNDRPLSGSLVIATLVGSASFRCLYGFLLLYLAFAVKAGELGSSFLGREVGSQGAVAVVGGALAVGTFLATAIGTRLRIRRPTALQSSGLTITAGVAVLTTIFFNLPMVALLSLVASIFSGISKLAVDASIQERVPERLRASAFAHSETVLMIAWVVGGAVGIIPLDGRLGIGLAAAFAVAAAARGTFAATRLHKERLHGRPDVSADDEMPPDPFGPDADPIPTSPAPAGAARSPQQRSASSSPDTQTPRPPGTADTQASRPPGTADAQAPRRPGTADTQAPRSPGNADTHAPRSPGTADTRAPRPPGAAAQPSAPTSADPAEPAPKRRLFSRSGAKSRKTPPVTPPTDPNPAAHADQEQTGRTAAGPKPAAAPADRPRTGQTADRPRTGPGQTSDQEPAAGPEASPAPPGFHIYRPSSAANGNGSRKDDNTP